MAVLQASTPNMDQFFDSDRDEMRSFGDSPTLTLWDPEFSSTSDTAFEWSSSPFSLGSLPPSFGQSRNNGVSLNDLETQPNPEKSEVHHDQIVAESSDLVPGLGRKQENQLNKTLGNHVQIPAHEQGRQHNRKPRTKKAVDPYNAVAIEKRVQLLERNRVAASKCRKKRREWMQDLHTKVEKLEKTKEMLTNRAETLKEEVYYLRGEMYKHSSCQSPQIDAHIQSHVGRLSNCGDMGPHHRQQATEDDSLSSCCSMLELHLDPDMDASSSARTAPSTMSPVEDVTTAKVLTNKKIEVLLEYDLVQLQSMIEL